MQAGPPPKNPYETGSGNDADDLGHEFGSGDAYGDQNGTGYSNVPISDDAYGNGAATRDVELGYDDGMDHDNAYGGNTGQPATFSTEAAKSGSDGKGFADYMSRVPIQWLSIAGSLWMSTGAILNIVFGSPSISVVILDGYMIVFGMVMFCVQLPKFPGYDWTSPIRRKIEKWALFMATLWGRGAFFIFVAFMCLAESSTIRTILGITVILLGFLSLFAGRLAAAKFNRIRDYCHAGKEGDDLVEQLRGLALDLTQGAGSLRVEHFRQLAIRAGRTLGKAELHAIFAFFDRDRNGEVSIDTFVAVLMSPAHKNIKSL